MSKAERHQHILLTATRLFQERGYEHVTIADVIHESNIARGTFYLHFDSLEKLLSALFEQVVEEAWTRIAPILNDASIPFQTCTMEVVHAVFGMFSDDKGMGVVFYSGGGREFVERKHEAMFDKLGGLLVGALERRHRIHIPTLKWTAAMLISLVGDMSYYAVVNPSVNASEDTKAAFEEQLNRFVLAGLREHLRPYVRLEDI